MRRTLLQSPGGPDVALDVWVYERQMLPVISPSCRCASQTLKAASGPPAATVEQARREFASGQSKPMTAAEIVREAQS